MATTRENTGTIGANGSGGTAPPPMGDGADAAEAMAMESGAVTPEAAAAAAEQAGIGPGAAILGSVAWLMARSPMHRHAFLADLEWRVLPAIALGQCRLAQQDGKPVAFISWATVSDEVEARLAAGDLRIRPDEWKSGDRRVFVDVIAPFGGAEALVREKVFGKV